MPISFGNTLIKNIAYGEFPIKQIGQGADLIWSAVTKLNTPSVTISSTGLATWPAINNAASYEYIINSQAAESTISRSVQLSVGQTIRVRAIPSSSDYAASDYSARKTYSLISLSSPTITIEANGQATWSSVSNAAGYQYKINDGDYSSTTAPTYVYLNKGDTLYVIAKGDNITYSDSYASSKTYSGPTSYQGSIELVIDKDFNGRVSITCDGIESEEYYSSGRPQDSYLTIKDTGGQLSQSEIEKWWKDTTVYIAAFTASGSNIGNYSFIGSTDYDTVFNENISEQTKIFYIP